MLSENTHDIYKDVNDVQQKRFYAQIYLCKIKVKVTLEQAMKAQRGT